MARGREEDEAMFRLIGSGDRNFGDFKTFGDAQVAAVHKYGRNVVIGDVEHGRALVWESEERAANDSGYAACAKIVEVQP